SPESELDQTPTLSAIQSIQSYLNTYPQSKRVEESNSIIRELRKKLEVKAYQNALFFYNAKNYKSAIQALGNFEKDYPDSDFMEEVSFKKLETSYEMAMQSVMSKQTARLKETISFYEEFKAKFPNTTYSKEVENIYASSQKKIEEIKNLDKKDN
ncbi:MAG: outer membrane protein assembly factor BamD, partial [Thermonemataceae bacterium]|nr:outer membrane protein assembly factor BamD [Thermonemataceae bacterium]